MGVAYRLVFISSLHSLSQVHQTNAQITFSLGHTHTLAKTPEQKRILAEWENSHERTQGSRHEHARRMQSSRNSSSVRNLDFLLESSESAGGDEEEDTTAGNGQYQVSPLFQGLGTHYSTVYGWGLLLSAKRSLWTLVLIILLFLVRVAPNAEKNIIQINISTLTNPAHFMLTAVQKTNVKPLPNRVIVKVPKIIVSLVKATLKGAHGMLLKRGIYTVSGATLLLMERTPFMVLSRSILCLDASIQKLVCSSHS
mmetsp:Transcript_18214/g.28358  ORF Transcript_18214/g.28358 Transcript_18214/m.28358 type:complete len:254 (-) Transcript_18214:243-1004(-)